MGANVAFLIAVLDHRAVAVLLAKVITMEAAGATMGSQLGCEILEL